MYWPANNNILHVHTCLPPSKIPLQLMCLNVETCYNIYNVVRIKQKTQSNAERA